MTPLTHYFLKVVNVEGKDYLADLGFGDSQFYPLDLSVGDAVQDTGLDKRRIVTFERGFMVQALQSDGG